MDRAVVHDPPQRSGMIAWVLRRAPHARNAELAAATLIVVVRAVNLAPGMTATDRDAPALRFCMLKRIFDLFLWMRSEEVV